MAQKYGRGSLLLVLLALPTAGASPARADLVAVSLRSNGYQTLDAVIGWEFTTNTEITVTKLGWFDFTFAPLGGQPGLDLAHTVGIFTPGGQLLVSGTVSAGTASPAEGPPVTNTAGQETGVFRYVPVAPTALSAGQTYIIAGTSPSAFLDAFALGFPLSDLTTDPALTFVRGRLSPGSTATLRLPDVDPAPNGRNFGPNFQFVGGAQVVPEPSVLGLALFAGVGLVGYGWRRFRNR
jgi:hypothetical protein